EGGLGLLQADGLPNGAEHGSSRGTGREAGRERDDGDSNGRPPQVTLPARRHALVERGPHDLPCSLLGTLRDRHVEPQSSSSSWSSPRRSLELTVPRGSSSMRAISPGVWPRR